MRAPEYPSYAAMARAKLAELQRLDGHTGLKQPEPDETRAEGFFLYAIDVARSQEGRPAGTVRAIDFAQLWRYMGSPNDARALLKPKVHRDEGVATHIGPKPCAGVREDVGEASAGEHIGKPSSREIVVNPGADAVHLSEGKMDGRANAATAVCPRPGWRLGFG